MCFAYTYFSLVPSNRDGASAFLVHKQQVLVGTERNIHIFPILDDNEVTFFSYEQDITGLCVVW